MKSSPWTDVEILRVGWGKLHGDAIPTTKPRLLRSAVYVSAQFCAASRVPYKERFSIATLFSSPSSVFYWDFDIYGASGRGIKVCTFDIVCHDDVSFLLDSAALVTSADA